MSKSLTLRKASLGRNIGLMIILFGFFLLGVIWGGLFMKINEEKQQEMANAIKETKNFARTFEEHTLRTIRGADQAVLFLKYEFERQGLTIDIPRYVREGRFSSQPFVLMGIIAADGMFAASNQVPFVPSNLKDREHFLVHTEKDSQELYISKPVLGRSSGKWSIQMTRRINKPDGSLGGVVVIAVDPFYFTSFYKELDLGKNSSVTLVGLDGIVRARQAGLDSAVGQDVRNDSLMTRLKQTEEGSFISRSPVDGVVRIYSYRGMKDYPLAVLVGVDEKEYFAPLQERIEGYYSLAGLITLVIVLFTLGMYYAAKHRQAAEDALKIMLDNLEIQVEERTQELTRKNGELELAYNDLRNAQSQVIHQEKMASIGQLAAGVAHEINNPLGFVMSNFESLRKYTTRMVEVLIPLRQFRDESTRLDEKARAARAVALSELEKKQKIDYILGDVESIFSETLDGLRRVGDIVKALRLFSRVDQQGEREDYDLNEGVHNTLIVARNEIKYIAEVRENLSVVPLISAVGGQINQVLLNLMLNAAYAIKEKAIDGLGVIEVATYFDDTSVYCSVSDNGKGIPEHIKKDIFNPFFTTKPVGEGTGLGLSISYDIIVNKHHGEISLDSVEGVGTKFLIRLPINK
jgi:signal transduction histidine kinase